MYDCTKMLIAKSFVNPCKANVWCPQKSIAKSFVIHSLQDYFTVAKPIKGLINWQNLPIIVVNKE